MEHPNATWKDFSTRIIQRDVNYQVSSNVLNNEEQTQVQMASLGQEMKNLRSELQEHRVNAIENPRQPDPNQNGRQNATRFCIYCRTNRHTSSWCRKKIRDEEIKRVQEGMMAEKHVTFTNDYSKRRGPSHGSGQFTYNNTGKRNQAGRDITDTQQSTYDGATHFRARSNWGNPARNNTFNSGRGRPCIDIRIRSLTGRMTSTTGMALLVHRREEHGRILEPIHVLLLVRDEIHSGVDSISPRGIVLLISWYSDDPTAKNPVVLSPINSDSRERMTKLALTQCDLLQRTIQSMHYLSDPYPLN